MYSAPVFVKPASPVYRAKFHGSGLEMAILVLKNLIFSLLTLGVYSFWAKANLRDFLWRNCELNGHRLRYNGSGWELLVGFFQGLVIYLAISTALTFGFGLAAKNFGTTGILIYSLFLTTCYFALAPMAIFARQRYLFSRTTFMGLQFSLADNSSTYVKESLLGSCLVILTFGLYWPVLSNRLYRIRINSGSVGSMRMLYVGSDRDAFLIFLKSLPLIIITLGIYFFWYRADALKFRMKNTWIGNSEIGAACGELDVNGFSLLILTIVNLLAIMLTFGLAFPWVLANNLKFYMTRFSFEGRLDLAKVSQVRSQGSAVGDGFASVMGA